MAGFDSKGCDEFQFCMIRKGLHCWSGDQQWQKKQPTVKRAVYKSRQSLLMRQFGPQYAIEVSACHGGYQIHNKHSFATTQQYEHGRRASTCQGPTHTKYESTNEVAVNGFVFIVEGDFVAFHVFDMAALHDLYNDDAGHNGGANDAKHVKALKTEHFINAEPGYGFAFVQNETQQHAYEYVARHSHNGSVLEGKQKG